MMNYRSSRREPPLRAAETSGKTVDDAIQNALRRLRARREEVDVEVLDKGSSGFLGFGAKDARVRVSLKSASGQRRPPLPPVGGRTGDVRVRRSGPPIPREERNISEALREVKRSRGIVDRDRDRDRDQDRDRDRDQDRDRGESLPPRRGGGDRHRPRRSESDQGRPAGGGRSRRMPQRPMEEDRPQLRPRVSMPPAETRPPRVMEPMSSDAGSFDRGEPDEALRGQIGAFARGLLERMGFPIDVETEYADGGYDVRISGGENDAILIGRRGETLEALQHVISKMASRGKEDLVRVRVDVSDYRIRKNEQLAEKALAMAEKVRQSGREVVTEPLAAAERRIIHRALAEQSDIKTHALGDGLVKRVWIGPASAQPSARDEGRFEEVPMRDEDSTYARPLADEPQAIPAAEAIEVSQVSDSVGWREPVVEGPRQDAPTEAPEWGRRPKPAKGRRSR
jgi:spoIIIJ-associated protein